MVINRIYSLFCRIELWTTACLLLAIATLVFISAVARTIGQPLNWATDISLLLFAWMVFLGGDVVIRETNLISVDMFQKKLPPWMQKTLMLIFYVMMMVFLVIMARYGVPLARRNWKRQFQVLPISYSWCTLAVVVGSILMCLSTLIRTVKLFLPGKGAGGAALEPEARKDVHSTGHAAREEEI